MTNYKLRITNWFTPKYKYFTKNKLESYFLTIPKQYCSTLRGWRISQPVQSKVRKEDNCGI